jgi:hypothetical protein
MSPKIASHVRRKFLVAGAAALSVPKVTWAVSGQRYTQAVASPPVLLPEAAAGRIESFASELDPSQLRAGERLILSGRLTDVNAGAIAHAVIAVVGIQATTLSDADGRFLFFTTVPRGDRLELQVSAPSGGVLRKVVNLLASTHPSAPHDSVAANSLYEGQQVWRSSFSLSMTA